MVNYHKSTLESSVVYYESLSDAFKTEHFRCLPETQMPDFHAKNSVRTGYPNGVIINLRYFLTKRLKIRYRFQQEFFHNSKIP